MKKLIFVRHGKAEDDAPEISDFERSLTLRGKLISRLMAHRFKAKEKTRLTLITSPAFRALETALIFAGELGISAERIIMSSYIYQGISLENLPEILASTAEDAETVVLFGHNPTFSDISNSLSKEGCEDMPKSAVICLSFSVSTWSEITRNKGKLEYFLKPEKKNE